MAVGCLGAVLMACTDSHDATPDAASPTSTGEAAAAPDDTPAPCLAQVYAGVGFVGEGACLPTGTTTLAQLKALGLTQDAIGSLVLDPGYRLTVWTSAATEPFQTATAEAAVALAGVTRIEVTPCVGGLFENADGRGAGICVEAGFHDAASLARRGLRPGQTRSVVIASGYRATIIREPSEGPATVIARGTLDLSDAVSGAMVSIDVVRDDRSATATGVTAAATRKDLTSFRRIYVLGDSLSDQQNQRSSLVPRCPNQHNGYWNGRFTNGYNWVDYLTQDNPSIAAKLVNKAVGGSKVLVSAIARPSLMSQATTLIAALPATTRRADLANSLVIIWGGANDVKEKALSSSPGDAVTFANNIVAEFQDIVATLENAGVVHIVFVGVPYIDRVPVARGWTAAQRTWTSTTVYRLNTDLGDYARANGYLYSTVPAMILDWLDHRLVSVNMTDTTQACGTMGACDPTISGTYVEKVCTKKMFFDPLHPTSGAHCGVAKRIENTLASKYNAVFGSTATIESCARRLQAADFSGTPARRIRFDVQRASINSQTTAASACPALCDGAFARWNGNWTNVSLPNPVSQGGSYTVGVCGCDR